MEARGKVRVEAKSRSSPYSFPLPPASSKSEGPPTEIVQPSNSSRRRSIKTPSSPLQNISFCPRRRSCTHNISPAALFVPEVSEQAVAAQLRRRHLSCTDLCSRGRCTSRRCSTTPPPSLLHRSVFLKSSNKPSLLNYTAACRCRLGCCQPRLKLLRAEAAPILQAAPIPQTTADTGSDPTSRCRNLLRSIKLFPNICSRKSDPNTTPAPYPNTCDTDHLIPLLYLVRSVSSLATSIFPLDDVVVDRRLHKPSS